MIELFGFEFSAIEFAVLGSFCIALLIQLFYLILISGFIFGDKKKKGETQNPSISIVITSRNYAVYLNELLPTLLEQDYRDFEIVVVDDCSSDNTEWILKEMKLRYANLKSTRIIQETDFPNALAITVGIRAATKEWVVFLNPLCQVPDKNWLKSYAEMLRSEKEAVIGYVNYQKSEGKSTWKISYENFYSFLIYGTARLIGLPMPVSEYNMAYRREKFLKMKGFAAVLDSPFSENELFLNKISTKKNTAYLFDQTTPASYIGESDWIDSVNFKKKQLLIKQKFSLGQRFFLSLNTGSRFVLNVSMIISIIILPWRFWVAGAWVFLLIIETIWIALATKRLGEKNMLPGLLLYNSMMPLINLFYIVNQLFTGQKRKWK